MRSTEATWFHCGNCGTLFRVAGMEAAESSRICSACGQDPVPVTAAAPEADPGVLPPPRERISEGYEARKRMEEVSRRMTSRIMKRVALAWVLVLLAVVLWLQNPWRGGQAEEETTGIDYGARLARGTEADGEVAALREAATQIQSLFGAYLAAPEPAARAQFVFNPLAMVPRMERYHGLDASHALNQDTLENSGTVMLDVGGRRAVETLWRSGQGLLIDAVFLESGGEWRLDWEHFVRYSTHPWNLFLAGGGEPSGEFRLLARRRQGESEDLSVVFHTPNFGRPGETSGASREFNFPLDSENARRLLAGFARAEEGRAAFDSQASRFDPPNMIRVRVRMSREGEGAERSFTLDSVEALHWLGVPDPGFPASFTSSADPS